MSKKCIRLIVNQVENKHLEMMPSYNVRTQSCVKNYVTGNVEQIDKILMNALN